MSKEVHPNSLKNLAPSFTKENAREMQLRSAASRKASSDARQALKLTIKLNNLGFHFENININM